MSATPHPSEALASLLLFYQDSGVDCAVLEEPQDRFTAVATPAVQLSSRTMQTAPSREKPISNPPAEARPAMPQGIVLAADQAVFAAKAAAAEAQSLDDLRKAMDTFKECGLKATATQLVFADGPEAARIMIVGDVPSREDDLAGKPFTGPAGAFFGKALTAAGLDPASVYVTTLLPWRPPGGREPTQHEIAVCLPFLERHIALKKPDLLLCLGDKPVQRVMQMRDGILKTRGQWLDLQIDGHACKALATLNPEHGLKTPAMKKWLWRDLLALKAAEQHGTKP